MSSPPDELSRSIASAVSMAVERAVDQALSAIVPTPSVATTQEVCIFVLMPDRFFYGGQKKCSLALL